MRHTNALILKLLAYLLLFGITMPVLGRLALPKSLILAGIHTLLLWLADLIILPRFGSVAAAVGDFLVLVIGSFLVLGAMGSIPRPMGLILAVGLGTAFEVWYHYYLNRHRVLEF